MWLWRHDLLAAFRYWTISVNSHALNISLEDAPVIEGLKIRQGKDGFTVSYTATAKDKDQGMRYAARIEGKTDGTVLFQVTATPLTDFLTKK